MLRVGFCLLLLLFSSASLAQSDVNSAEVRAFQSALKERGYDLGPADGDLGGRTASAVRKFETASGSKGTKGSLLQRLRSLFPEIAAQYRVAAELTIEEIKAVQTALKDRGFDPGPVDGDFGQSTAVAIGEYEKASELPVTGKITLVLQHRLDAITPQTLARYREAARQGRPDALNSLGDIYANGYGVTKDVKEADGWYRKAARKGHAGAQYRLGTMYGKGRGVPQDDDEAARWYRLAAEQGHAEAQYIVADMYKKGRGIPQDFPKAAAWYRKAAEQGNDWAQYSLGDFYSNGRGVPKRYDEAAKWFRLAADQGNDWAQYSLGELYSKGRGVAKRYDEAAKWFLLAAEQGNDWAQFSLGELYDKGHGVPKDDVAAHVWFQLAAAQGHEQAQKRADATASAMDAGQIEEAERMVREWQAQHKN